MALRPLALTTATSSRLALASVVVASCLGASVVTAAPTAERAAPSPKGGAPVAKAGKDVKGTKDAKDVKGAKDAKSVKDDAEPPSDPDATPERQEAARRYKLALDLAKDGSLDASIAELERAYALAPSFRILYNLALVQLQLKDHAAALQAFERYLADGGDDVPEERRQQVTAEIERLQSRVGKLDVAAAPAGWTVLVDGVERGTTPLPAPLLVNTGRRHVEVRRDGKSQSRVEQVASGQVVPVKLTFEPPPPPPAPPPPPPPMRDPRLAPTVAWAVTGGLATVTLSTGIGALVAKSYENDLKTRAGVTEYDLRAAGSSVEQWAIVTDVLLVATVLSAGVSAYLTFDAMTSDDGSTSARIVVHPTGAFADVRF